MLIIERNVLFLHHVSVFEEKMAIVTEKTIDIDQILKSKMGSKAKYIPRPLVGWLKRIAHQDDVNAFLWENRDKSGVEWLEEFRRVPRASAKCARLEEGREGSVAQFGQHLHLARETRNGCGIRSMEYLERRHPLTIHLDRSVDLAGAAARDKGDDTPAPNLGAVGQRRPAVDWRMAPQPFLSCRFFIQHYQSQELATDH